MLTQLRVKNFRCLEDVDIPLSSITAFVGPNGSGKTTILRAIDIVLGEAWPSLRSLRIPQDFNAFETSKDLEITIEFDKAYVHHDTHGTAHSVNAIRFTCKPYKRRGKWGEIGDLHADLEPLDHKGRIPNVAVGQPRKRQQTQRAPLPVRNELRDHARILFIDHRRSLAQHIPSARGSILGRLLQKARREFTAEDDFRARYEAAMDVLRTDQVKEIERTVAETAKRMLGFLGTRVASSLEIGFGFADPANPFNSLRLEYRESGLAVPGDELGLGIQSAMVVGIFETFRQLGGDFGTIVIEEPEMYLHPQAQRYFFRLLTEMADNDRCQVIYSTHSPIFADVNRYETLRLVRRQGGKSTVAFVAESDREALQAARDRFKLGNRFDAARNEVVFASKALLVEGYGDRLAALLVAEQLGFDIDAEGAVVVDCGGKDGIELVVRVCRSLRIPFVVLHDADIRPTETISDPVKRKKQERENETEKVKNQRIKDAVGDAGALFVIVPSLEGALGISRDAADKPKKIVAALSGLALEDAGPELTPLVEAVGALLSSDSSTRSPQRVNAVTESVQL